MLAQEAPMRWVALLALIGMSVSWWVSTQRHTPTQAEMDAYWNQQIVGRGLVPAR
jgi:hypothetical protein